VGTLFERDLMALWNRGGVVGGTSAGAAILSQRMIAGGNPLPRLGVGFEFLPDAVIDQHFSQRNRLPRLRSAIASGPPLFGVGIDEGTALIVEGRRIEVIGESNVTICLPASPMREAREYLLQTGRRDDLTALRRAARDRRTDSRFAKPATNPAVPSGSLFIAGGGRLRQNLIERFIELAGGPDALIAILPTASESQNPDGASDRQMFERAGARRLTVLGGRERADVESAEFLETLAQARGIWFGGGRQWRFVDAYDGTRAVAAFHDVLRRGGVVGGSSAGASIQAEFLVRGSPLGNTIMLAEGYERGFGFLPGVAIDQHFTQRNRRADLEDLVRRFPQILGIGIDESTALVVRGSQAEVIGEHRVFFIDQAFTAVRDLPLSARAGDAYDFIQRRVVPGTPGE
jgi:cyanophycinase